MHSGMAALSKALPTYRLCDPRIGPHMGTNWGRLLPHPVSLLSMHAESGSVAEGEGFEPSMDEKTPITVFETLTARREGLLIHPFLFAWGRW